MSVFTVGSVNASTTFVVGGINSGSSAPPPILTPPLAPAVVASAGDGRADVSWSDTGNGGAEITGWSVRLLSVTPGTEENPQPVETVLETLSLPGTTTLHTFTGLVNDLLHIVEVTGINEVGAGATGTATFTPAVQVPAPLPPVFTATGLSGAVEVVFTLPVGGEPPVTSYNLSVAQGEALESYEVPPDGQPFLVTGLLNGLAVTLTATAQNATGFSTPVSIFATPTPAPVGEAPPGQVQNLLVEPRDLGAVLDWEPPLDAGSRPVTGYLITATPTGSLASLYYLVPNTGGSISGLSGTSDYQVTVRAVSLAGLGVEAVEELLIASSPNALLVLDYPFYAPSATIPTEFSTLIEDPGTGGGGGGGGELPPIFLLIEAFPETSYLSPINFGKALEEADV